MRLAKTDYLLWRKCRHDAWIRAHMPDLYYAGPHSAFGQAIVDAGIEVEALARRLFPGGVEIDRDDIDATRDHVARRTAVLFRPAFVADTFAVTPDILAWNGAADDVYAVKASTGGDGKDAKYDSDAHDLGFQAHVLGLLGVPIGRLLLMRLDNEYVRRDELEIDELFALEDFAERVLDRLPDIAAESPCRPRRPGACRAAARSLRLHAQGPQPPLPDLRPQQSLRARLQHPRHRPHRPVAEEAHATDR
jgi:hypothetical protein